jgi:hypothetical protein
MLCSPRFLSAHYLRYPLHLSFFLPVIRVAWGVEEALGILFSFFGPYRGLFNIKNVGIARFLP